MSQKKPLIGVLLFAGVFLYLGWEFVRMEIGFVRGGSASESWPAVDGQIITSTITSSYRSGSSREKHIPVVEFEYSVEGKSFRGDRIRFATSIYSDYKSAEVVTKRYSVGRTVPVFYDPEDASNSVLEPGKSGSRWYLIGIGIVIAAFAGKMLVTRLRQSSS